MKSNGIMIDELTGSLAIWGIIP